MILLVGGTSETAPIALGLAEAGCAVLVSTATDIPLDTGNHHLISRRSGPLVEERMVELIRERKITALVDAAHPYAASVHDTISRVAARLNIACFIFRRPAELQTEEKRKDSEILLVEDHAEAARLACAGKSPVLLTTGSRNLCPYAEEAKKTGTPLVVRVLDSPESLAACREAGIPEERIIAGRGPFSTEENLAAILRFRIGTIVTKESGRAGGFAEKIAAARRSKCRLIVIKRPPVPPAGTVFDSISLLTEAVAANEHSGTVSLTEDLEHSKNG